MGCTSTTVVQSRRVVPLPPEAVNSYIDRFPAIILIKIKQKFQLFADKETKRLNIFHFIKLHSVTQRNTDMLRRLFQYYSDNNQNENIAFRQFIVKYATLVKGEAKVLYNILFQIYKNSIGIDRMDRQQFENFYQNETFFFGKQPKVAIFPIDIQQFYNILIQAHFNTQQYQNKLSITTEEDIPFKMISRQILDCDFNDFSIGKEYYLLSNAWYHRWSFYYQELDVKSDRQRIKSTKFILSEESTGIGRRYKKRQMSVSERRLNDSSLRTSQLNNTLLQQPKIIDFQDIQGQYRGQLKENLKITTQVKVITDGLWQLLCKLHPPEQEFKRVGISQDKLQYYPKSIYYFQTDDKGHILFETQTIIFISVTKKVAHLKKNKSGAKIGVFTKNFGQKNWRQLQDKRSFAQVSLQPRFLVVLASDRQKFIEKFYRKQIKKENLQPGDQIYAHFPYIRSHSQAYIINYGKSDRIKIHFKGYSFRYELQISKEEASIIQAEAVSSSAKKKHETIIKGISNVGNTCFMNAVIQCLVATPILDAFLTQYAFNQKKQPIGFGLSEIAKALLNNHKPDAKNFKKLIDANIPVFSGYEQHDAQQFLNILLDKITEQISEKPTVIDYLFGGNIQSKLACASCNNIKHINQKMYILSLPIPQPQFNYFSIVVVPVTSKTLKKMIFKLHKNATISDYCSTFEQRSGYNKKDFVFVETSQNSLKKIKQEILRPSQQKKKITDMGIVPNVSLLAFEKIPQKFYSDILLNKSESIFKDIQAKPQTPWTLCKNMGSRTEKNQYIVEYVSQDNTLEKVRIDKDIFAERTAKLGSKTQSNFKKIILRKYNSSLKKLQQFGLQFLVGIPLWATFEDVIRIAQRYLQNLKEKQAKHFREKKGGDYLIKLLFNYRCIFCQKESPVLNVQQSQITYCCDVLQKNIPLFWSAKTYNFSIFIDWIDLSKCNSMFCSYIQVDLISRNVQNTRQDEFVTLQSCLKLQNQTQNVEMQCDKCKHKYQNLQHLIDKVPNILVIHMKEFRYTSQGHLIKIDLRLKWQEFLDSSKFTIQSNGKLYELFAVVRHSGNSESGHYTCIAKRKHPFENRKVWVLFDDDSTDIIKQEQSFIDEAYLLCYKKVDMPTSALVMYADLNTN